MGSNGEERDFIPSSLYDQIMSACLLFRLRL